jgi:hypothetical protein
MRSTSCACCTTTPAFPRPIAELSAGLIWSTDDVEAYDHLAPLLGRPPGTITSGQGSYDLRRLRAVGLVERIPHTYTVTR